MKILYASVVDVSDTNGPSVNEREFVFALQRDPALQVRCLLGRPRHPELLADLRNVRFVGVPESRWFFVLNQLSLFAALKSELARAHYDLIVVRCGQLPIGAALLANATPVPIALKTQGDPGMRYLCSQPGMKGWISRCLRPVNLWAVQRLVQRALAVDCCTPQLVALNLAHLQVADREKFFIVDNATNIERFAPQDVRDCRARLGLSGLAPILGYVGGAPWERGGVQIIRAVARLKERFPGIGAAVVGGGGASLERLRGLARQLEVADRCVIPGAVPYEQVPLWINSFDVGVALDLAEHAGHVGSSNQKIRQYLACGKPVVAANGANEFLEAEQLGVLVEAEDADGFAGAAAALLAESEEARLHRAARARRYAEARLSVESALARRMQFWLRRLSAPRTAGQGLTESTPA